MRDRMVSLSDELATRRMPVDDAGRREAQEFLRWAADDHFTFFGYREYRIEQKGGERILRGGRRRPGPAARQGPFHHAQRQVPGGALHAAVGCGRYADPDQDQCALQRAPPGQHGLHRRARIRRQGQSGGRAALHRPVHLQRLQPPSVGNPAGARAPRTRDAPIRPVARQPQRQGAAPHPGNAAARGAVPVQRGGTLSAPAWASWACRNACAASCSCAATAMAGSSPRWCTSRANVSTPTCACASRRC